MPLFSPDQLTDLFRRSSALDRGSVVAVQVDKQVESVTSTLTFLGLTYSSDTSPTLPHHIVLKQPLSQNEISAEVSPTEVDFYARLAPKLPSPPIVPWYLITSDGDLILQDLRATHTSPSWPDPPSDSECMHVVATLSHAHSQWWENSELGVTIGSPHTSESLTTMVTGIAALLPGFCDAAGDFLSRTERKLMERVFGSSLKPWLRLIDSKALTLSHGDAHCWNFLYPREGDGPVYLLDWQLWHVDIGARDLAFLITAHWDRERRQSLELTLLRHYHEELLKRQIPNYAWDDLWLDYRLSTVRNLTIPLFNWNRGFSEEVWLLRLRCALAAFQDLDCDEVL